MRQPTHLLTIALMLAGCPRSIEHEDSGPAPADSGHPRLDAGTQAGTDAGLESRVDSGLDAATPPVDAGPERCDVESATRTAPCGNCGLASERCTAGLWARTSACLDEGECSPGSVAAEDLEMCGERQRICNDACTWRDWTMTRAPGECEAGASRYVAAAACVTGLQPQRCGAMCAWEDDGPCDDGCGGTARSSPEWKREVCIPAGPFIRGFVGDFNASPVAEIEMSAYCYGATRLRGRWPGARRLDEGEGAEHHRRG
jgi:hypothetical protein